jgi:hypothetical protein
LTDSVDTSRISIVPSRSTDSSSENPTTAHAFASCNLLDDYKISDASELSFSFVNESSDPLDFYDSSEYDLDNICDSYTDIEYIQATFSNSARNFVTKFEYSTNSAESLVYPSNCTNKSEHRDFTSPELSFPSLSATSNDSESDSITELFLEEIFAEEQSIEPATAANDQNDFKSLITVPDNSDEDLCTIFELYTEISEQQSQTEYFKHAESPNFFLHTSCVDEFLPESFQSQQKSFTPPDDPPSYTMSISGSNRSFAYARPRIKAEFLSILCSTIIYHILLAFLSLIYSLIHSFHTGFNFLADHNFETLDYSKNDDIFEESLIYYCCTEQLTKSSRTSSTSANEARILNCPAAERSELSVTSTVDLCDTVDYYDRSEYDLDSICDLYTDVEFIHVTFPILPQKTDTKPALLTDFTEFTQLYPFRGDITSGQPDSSLPELSFHSQSPISIHSETESITEIFLDAILAEEQFIEPATSIQSHSNDSDSLSSIPDDSYEDLCTLFELYTEQTEQPSQTESFTMHLRVSPGRTM